MLLDEQMSFSGSDFDIKDDQGKCIYKVTGQVLSIRDAMIINDTSGNKLCALKKSFTCCGRTYLLYKYTPAFQGQQSTSTDSDSTPIFLFGEFREWCCVCPMGGKYSLVQSDDDSDVKTVMYAQDECCTGGLQIVVHTDQDGEQVPVAKIGQTSALQFAFANHFAVEVAAGIDPLAALCFGIVFDQWRDDSKRRHRRHRRNA
jgi:hypothetical protein